MRVFAAGWSGDTNTAAHPLSFCVHTLPWQDLATRTTKNQAECQAACAKTAGCTGISHGTYGGTTDTCVLCTSTDWQASSWAETRVRVVDGKALLRWYCAATMRQGVPTVLKATTSLVQAQDALWSVAPHPLACARLGAAAHSARNRAWPACTRDACTAARDHRSATRAAATRRACAYLLPCTTR